MQPPHAPISSHRRRIGRFVGDAPTGQEAHPIASIPLSVVVNYCLVATPSARRVEQNLVCGLFQKVVGTKPLERTKLFKSCTPNRCTNFLAGRRCNGARTNSSSLAEVAALHSLSMLASVRRPSWVELDEVPTASTSTRNAIAPVDAEVERIAREHRNQRLCARATSRAVVVALIFWAGICVSVFAAGNIKLFRRSPRRSWDNGNFTSIDDNFPTWTRISFLFAGLVLLIVAFLAGCAEVLRERCVRGAISANAAADAEPAADALGFEHYFAGSGATTPGDPLHRAACCLTFGVAAPAGSDDVLIRCVHAAGDLGRVRVFVSANAEAARAVEVEGESGEDFGQHKKDRGEEMRRAGAWRKWTPVADVTQGRRWSQLASIPLRVGVRVKAGTTRTFLLHVTAEPAGSGGGKAGSREGGRDSGASNGIDSSWMCTGRDEAPLLYSRAPRPRRCPPSCTATGLGYVYDASTSSPSAQQPSSPSRQTTSDVRLHPGCAWSAGDAQPPPFVSGERAAARGVMLVGGVSYSLLSDGGGESESVVEEEEENERTQLVTLEGVQPAIGPINRQLIDEWRGKCTMPALMPLALPASGHGGGEAATQGGGSQSLEETWNGCRLARAMWLRHLGGEEVERGEGSGGSKEGSDVWLARVCASLQAIFSCELPAATLPIVIAASLTHPPRLGSKAATETQALLSAALAAPRTATGALDASAFELVREARACAHAWLQRRLEAYHASVHARCAMRLQAATPPCSVGLSDFSLLRRLGKGASGVCFAARKEDTCALFALKVVPLHRRTLKRKSPERGVAHLLAERRVGELVDASGSPFLCALRYAFSAGPLLYLAMPLCPGGTLATQFDERAHRRGECRVRCCYAHVTAIAASNVSVSVSFSV